MLPPPAHPAQPQLREPQPQKPATQLHLPNHQVHHQVNHPPSAAGHRGEVLHVLRHDDWWQLMRQRNEHTLMSVTIRKLKHRCCATERVLVSLEFCYEWHTIKPIDTSDNDEQHNA